VDRTWLQAWEDCVRDDGGMPHTAPNPYSAGGGPYWCGFIITASWNAYLNYGDEGFLKRYYPVMQLWLGYAEKYSPKGLLEGWPETEYRSWYLGDWAIPAGSRAAIMIPEYCDTYTVNGQSQYATGSPAILKNGTYTISYKFNKKII